MKTNLALPRSVNSSGWGLELVLVSLPDRLGHLVRLIAPDGSASDLALASVEDDAAQTWPSSPPLQSIHCELLPAGGTAALLVGMAGKSHWSASMESLPGEGALLFDFACRVRETPLRLGTTYQVQSATRQSIVPSNIQRVSEVEVLLSLGEKSLRLSGEPAATHPSPRMELSSDSPGKINVSCQVNQITAASTLRWRYRLAIE